MPFQMGNIQRRKALGIEKTYGSFEKGKKPGVVLIDETIFNRKRKESV